MSEQKKSVLGKGLGALFSNNEQELFQNEFINTEKDEIKGEKNAENSVVYIDINKITPNRKQPRQNFNDETLQELSESIKIHGVIQPIIVKSISNGYEIIAGERRWRASRIAGLKEIPCIIKTYSDRDNLLVALIENLQRENLNAMDESSAYYYMMESFGLTQEEISKNVGKSRSYIANAVRLQKLSETVKEMIIDGKLSAGHGRTLLVIEDFEKQNELARLIFENQLSVRETENLVKSVTDTRIQDAEHKNINADSSNNVFKAIESEIKNSIGAKVKIKEKNNKGTIQLSFYSREELERLIELLTSIK